MPSRSNKSGNNGNAHIDDSDLPRDYKPIIIERKNKFSAYDKNGKLIILGYDRKIVERYAYDRIRKS